MAQNADSWMVLIDGDERGPATAATVVEAIMGGLSEAAKVRRSSDRDWVGITSHPPFADAFRKMGVGFAPATTAPAKPQPKVSTASLAASATVTSSRRTSGWMVVGALSAALSTALLVAVLVFVILGKRAAAESVSVQKEQLAAIGRLTDAVRASEKADFAEFAKVPNNCIATNTGVTCHFTNTSAGPVETCAVAVLFPKDPEGGRSLKSLPVCSGRIRPNETKSAFAPWTGGFADELCFRRSWGVAHLDWDKCEFKLEGFKP